MRVVVIGAGAMGSLFGAYLSPVADVVLIDQNEDHIEQIRLNGLTVEQEDGGKRIYRVEAETIPDKVRPGADLAIVFTKSSATQEAAAVAASLLQQDGLALTMQNGLGNVQLVAGAVGEQRTLAGVTSHGGTFLGPGVVRHAGGGDTFIAPVSKYCAGIDHIIKLFGAAGIAVHQSDQLESLVWGKLIVNVGINALAAILRVQNGIIGRTPEAAKLMYQAVDEAAAVAKALGITLPYSDPRAEVLKVCQKTGQNKASMLQDVLRSATTEVEVINGAIVKYGAEKGIATPVNTLLLDIVRALEATTEHRL